MSSKVTSKDIDKLLDEQLNEWDLAKGNFDALQRVETKDFPFGGFSVRVQFNPARIQSTAAKVDTKSIKERKCFLCPQNLPEVQRGLAFGEGYQVLVNPYPIFPKHYTIPTFDHVDQLILDRYGDMLDLAKDLDEFSIFYNGPKCGASAPDHAHFQAGNKGFMPIEKDVKSIQKELVYETSDLKVYALREYLRNAFLLESANKESLVGFFKKLYSLLEIKEGEKEPMMNLITWYENGKWESCVFPRENHRPKCFFAEGDKNLLISPASVDMGGVFITPQEKDFRKITADDIKAILEEVCLPNDKMEKIVSELKKLKN
ncbi:MAG: DUF4922 domain-containing protein [Dysgonomonas sp.]